ncbi:hypothetical protein I553_0638 [Mycobacterium xenopi 4042]|uniref:Uncharacterized protein n=1 Tax=Mycobacterium xenopi 4042 TaxID=1299334 RepID=X7YK25_MYCXE|nr:hypothetical protein I553_0638 [Mycobacterium xenopi 4042]
MLRRRRATASTMAAPPPRSTVSLTRTSRRKAPVSDTTRRAGDRFDSAAGPR